MEISADVRWWAKFIRVLAVSFIWIGTIGAFILALQSNCAEEGMFGCYEKEYPYIVTAITAGLSNLLVAGTVAMIAAFVEWRVAAYERNEPRDGFGTE